MLQAAHITLPPLGKCPFANSSSKSLTNEQTLQRANSGTAASPLSTGLQKFKHAQVIKSIYLCHGNF